MAGSKRILVVDDEVDVLDTIRVGLEIAGFEVLAAYDGQEGLEIARAEHPELILLDVQMPKLNGFQLCRELALSPDTNGIPVLFLSARTDHGSQLWGKESGALGYICKPFAMRELVEKINETLNKLP